MALIRQSRQKAIHRIYHNSALLYVLVSVAALLLAATVPTPAALADAAAPRWQSLGASAFFIVIAAALVWTAHRKWSVLLSLLCLLQAAMYSLGARGARLKLSAEAESPESTADPSAVLAFIQEELATATPFYERVAVAVQTPLPLGAALSRVPFLGASFDPQAGPAVTPAAVLYAAAALMILAALVLWRAARRAPPPLD